MSSSLKKLLKGSFWLVLTNFITRFAGFIVLPLIARLLGPADLGIYNLLQNTIQTADGLSRIGIDAAIHFYGAQYQTSGTESVGRTFGVGSCLTWIAGGFIAILLCVARQSIARDFLGDVTIEPWLVLAGVSAFITVIGNPSWFYLVALQAFKTYSLRTSVITIAGGIITLLLTWGWGLNGTLWSFLIIALIQTIWGWWLTLPILNVHGIKLRYDNFIPEAIKLLKFGLPFYSSNFLSSFVALPLLGYVSKSGGIEQLGYLRVAQSLSQFVSFLPTAIAPVLISSMAESLGGDSKQHQQLKSLHLRVLWSIILFISFIISFNLDSIVNLLFGASFNQAILLSRLTIWIAAVTSLSGMMTQYLIGAGRTRVIAVIQTISLILMVIIAMIMIPQYNSLGLLIAQAVSICFRLVAYTKPSLSDIHVSEHKYLWLLTFESCILFTLSFLPSILPINIFIGMGVSIVVLGMASVLTFLCCFTNQEKSSTYLLFRKLILKTSSFVQPK